MPQTYKQKKESRKRRGICLDCPNPLNGMSLRCRTCVRRLNQRNGSNTEVIINTAKCVPCADCGIQYDYWIMEFDHVRGVKEFNISSCRGDNVGLGRLRLEIAKCDVVCSNCHRDRTYWRMQMARKVIPTWHDNSDLADLGFVEKAARYKELKDLIEPAETERKALAVELETILMAASVDQVMYEGLVCSRRNGGQPSRIDATKLLEAGVDADVIAAATVPGGKYTYFEMRDPAKQKDNRKHKGGDDSDTDSE